MNNEDRTKGENAMQVSKKISFILAASLLLLLSGCLSSEQQAGLIQPDSSLHGSPGTPGSVDPQSGSIVKRFQDAAPQSRTAVDSAIELLEKHAELSRQAAELDRANQGLIAVNNQLKAQVTSLEGELKQAQKELTEANDLLIEMRVELNNWKTSILGFRDEMRQAETAQLEALLRILRVLGGEVAVESAQGQDSDDTTAASVSPTQPGQAKVKQARPLLQGRGQAPNPGESNG